MITSFSVEMPVFYCSKILFGVFIIIFYFPFCVLVGWRLHLEVTLWV